MASTRVLVVGSPADREAIAELLELHGFEAAVAPLRELAEVAQRLRADVVIADVQTPEIEGRAFAAALRTLTPTPRGIALSSCPCPAFALGGITCLVKPVKLARLLDALAMLGRAA